MGGQFSCYTGSSTCKYLLVIPEMISPLEPFTAHVTVKRSETQR